VKSRAADIEKALPVERAERGDPRLRAVTAGLLAGMGLLAAGLWYLQIVAADRFRSRERRQTYRLVRVPGIRGRILDRAGRVLADNRPSYNLVLYIEEVRPLFREVYRRLKGRRRLSSAQARELSLQARWLAVSNLAQRAGAVIGRASSVTAKAFHRHYRNWPYRPMTLIKDLSPVEIARFLEQAAPVPGVDLEILPRREYPTGPLAAHAVGYVIRDDSARGDLDEEFNYSLPAFVGVVGVEAGFDEALRGKAGLKLVAVNSLCYREAEMIRKTAEPGREVVLSLDLELQQIARRALLQAGRYVRGAAVVLDVRNGDILAMVSLPSFDPNEFVRGISTERWTNWFNNPVFRPMLNRAAQGAYPPGSVFKIVTALACFEAGVLTPQSVTNLFYNPGYYQLGRRRIGDTAPPGEYDFRRAFKRSSNTYFIAHGLRAGMKTLVTMGKRFFFGERCGLPTRQESPGFFPTPKQARYRWSPGNLANVCIGQEITLTPLQAAVMTAAVANGGMVWRPRLVLGTAPTEAGFGGSPKKFPPRLRGRLGVDPRALAIIREAMLADTEERGGTGYKAFHAPGSGLPYLRGFRVGGKTGTAEVERPGGGRSKVAWFVSFGPYEDPRYAVAVMVEGGASGGSTCAPVARRIYQGIEARVSRRRANRLSALESGMRGRSG